MGIFCTLTTKTHVVFGGVWSSSATSSSNHCEVSRLQTKAWIFNTRLEVYIHRTSARRARKISMYLDCSVLLHLHIVFFKKQKYIIKLTVPYYQGLCSSAWWFGNNRVTLLILNKPVHLQRKWALEQGRHFWAHWSCPSIFQERHHLTAAMREVNTRDLKSFPKFSHC